MVTPRHSTLNELSRAEPSRASPISTLYYTISLKSNSIFELSVTSPSRSNKRPPNTLPWTLKRRIRAKVRFSVSAATVASLRLYAELSSMSSWAHHGKVFDNADSARSQCSYVVSTFPSCRIPPIFSLWLRRLPVIAPDLMSSGCDRVLEF